MTLPPSTRSSKRPPPAPDRNSSAAWYATSPRPSAFNTPPSVGACGLGVHENRSATDRRGQCFVESLVHGGVQGMARTQEDGIEVLVLFKNVLVEGDFAILVVRFAELLNRGKPFRSQVGQDMLDAPEAISPWFDPQADLFGRRAELVLHIFRHQPALFDFEISLLEAGEIDVGASQSNAGSALVFAELVGVHPVDLVEIVVEASGIDGGVPKHFRQVDII